MRATNAHANNASRGRKNAALTNQRVQRCGCTLNSRQFYSLGAIFPQQGTEVQGGRSSIMGCMSGSIHDPESGLPRIHLPRTRVNITNQHMRGDGNVGHSAPFIRSPALTTRGGNLPPGPGSGVGYDKSHEGKPNATASGTMLRGCWETKETSPRSDWVLR
jgi:hypothetical protein